MDPTTPTARLCDLMRQGFMRPRRARKPVAAPAPIVSCDACLNWHRQGKHTATPAERGANLAAARRVERARAAREYTAAATLASQKERMGFAEGEMVRHVSGDVGEVIGFAVEHYSLTPSIFVRVRNARGVMNLYPSATLTEAPEVAR